MVRRWRVYTTQIHEVSFWDWYNIVARKKLLRHHVVMIRLVFCLIMLSCSGFAQLTISPEKLEQNLAEHIQFSPDGPNYVGHIYVGGHQSQISQGTFIYIKNALEYYQELQPAFIILELDTPGGQVFPAQRISDALKEIDTQYEIPVVAFINNWAISAGAMLAYSCRYISIAKDASMGAAQPVTQTGEGTSEKVNSAIRADFANRAAFFERSPLIAEAMVDADMILVVRDKEIVELDNNDEIQSTDEVITKKGKLLTLSSKEMMDLGVVDIRLLPEKLSPITAKEKETGEWPAGKELLFTFPFFKQIPNAIVKSYQMDWKTRFFSILASPMVTSVLFLGLMLGVYMEFSTPGFGLPGIVGLICLFFIVLSSFALEAAGWLEFIILGVGVGLILLEVFVIPGFGIAGVVGIILALGGLFALLLPGIKEVKFDFDTKTLNAAGEYLAMRIVWLAGAIVVAAIVIAFLARYLVPRVAIFSPLVLKGEQETEKGYVSGLLCVRPWPPPT